MKKAAQVESDIKCMNQCMNCENFDALNRVLEGHKKFLNDYLEKGDAENVLMMKVTQNTLQVIKDIFKSPEKLKQEMARICNMRVASNQNKTRNIQRKKEIMV